MKLWFFFKIKVSSNIPKSQTRKARREKKKNINFEKLAKKKKKKKPFTEWMEPKRIWLESREIKMAERNEEEEI